jgi:nucleotidyltransferase substrate binding protein (TIGR01987 family)
LTWKTLKKALSFHGLEATNAREAFRLAAQQGWIANPKTWFVYLRKRNITVHEYQEQIMEKVYPVLPQFLKNLNSLIRKLEKL